MNKQTEQNQQQILCDIVIVGGGMVGGTLACGLAQRLATRNIVLIDAVETPLEWDDNNFDMRVSAITRTSQDLFEKTGLWSEIQEQRLTPYQEMFVWDAGGNGEIHFDSADMGEPDLGHIIENRVITAAIQHRIKEQQNIQLLCPEKIKSLAIDENNVKLTLESGKEIKASLLVGADGSRSYVRQEVGIAIKGWDFDQSALVTTVKTEKHHQHTAWQRFLKTGPLAFLPLPGEYSSIVWSTSPEEAQRLRALDKTDFAGELEQAFESKLGRIEEVAERVVFPLRLFETMEYIKHRVALVGDAAHTIHPLAGQGVNLGLADVASLIQVCADAIEQGKDIGSYPVLRRYERWRKADNRMMIMAMDGFKRLFGSELEVVKSLRNIGLNLVDKMTPLKNILMQQATGTKSSGSRTYHSGSSQNP